MMNWMNLHLKIPKSLDYKLGVITKKNRMDRNTIDEIVESNLTPDNEEDREFFFNETWKLYFHDPSSTNWNSNSYVHIADIVTIIDFLQIYDVLKEKLHMGMFFLMREHIFPKWDNEHNKNGSFVSIKVLKNMVSSFGEDILSKLLGETLINENLYDINTHWEKINGISFSPKKHFCIVKIWMKDNKIKNSNSFNISNEYNGNLLFKNYEYN